MRVRVYAWPRSRNCKRNPECMTIDGHYGRCILPTELTRKVIAEMGITSKKQLGLFGKD